MMEASEDGTLLKYEIIWYNVKSPCALPPLTMCERSVNFVDLPLILKLLSMKISHFKIRMSPYGTLLAEPEVYHNRKLIMSL